MHEQGELGAMLAVPDAPAGQVEPTILELDVLEWTGGVVLVACEALAGAGNDSRRAGRWARLVWT